MLGKSLTSYGSKLFSGPLGVVQVAFNGFDLGLTTDNTSLKPDLDVKDILYQQKGTKAYDNVITGADWVLTATFGKISTELLLAIAPYLIGSSGSVGHDSGHIKADMYESMMDSVAAALKVASVIDQQPSEELEDILNFYKVIPIISGDLLQWGADQQRNIPIEFKIKPKVMTTTESSTVKMSHGYWGDPTAEDLPAITWPDRAAPYIKTAEVASATSLEITFDEDITEISGITTIEQIVAKINSKFATPTASAYAEAVLTLTFADASFASGDSVELSIAEGTLEDSDGNANEAIDGQDVENDL